MAVYRYGISLLVFNSKKNEKNKKKMRFSITCEFLALTRKILGKKCFFLNLFIVAYFLWLSRLRPSIESC